MADGTNQRRTRGRPRGGSQEAPVQALDRGLHALEALARHGAATLTELSVRQGLPASTTHRLLTTLESHGMVDFDDASQEWSIGLEAFRIGSSYLKRSNLIEASRGVMRDLMEKTGETANLGVPDKDEIVFVSQFETHNPIRAFFRPGTRAPMHCSGVGKAMLAFMDRRAVDKIIRRRGLAQFNERTLTAPGDLYADLEATRARGWSLDDEERHLGMRCIAAPVFNGFAEPVAGVSISGPSVRLQDAKLAAIGEAVREAAKAITYGSAGVSPDE